MFIPFVIKQGHVIMNMAFFNDLYAHMEWADGEVWRTVLAMDAAHDDKTIFDALFHLHFTQQAFLDLWQGRKVDRPDPGRFGGLRGLLDGVRGYYPDVAGFLRDLPEDRLPSPLPVPWAKLFEKHIGRSAGVTTLAETILQVALHSTYHRGQVNRRIRELGGEPPLIDYIAWLWRGRPGGDIPL